jgi:hypothetical protein
MKAKYPLIIFITFLFTIHIPNVYALVTGDLEYQISIDRVYPGDYNREIQVELTSHSSNDIVVRRVGIQFDWMDSGSWIQKDYSNTPIQVDRYGGTVDFGIFYFSVPEQTTIGFHEFTITIEYDELHWYGWTYDDYWSENYQIEVYSLEEKPQLTSLEYNIPSEYGLDIVFIPEDYSISELDDFGESVEEYYTSLLSMEPFSQYLDRINIWRIDTTVDFESWRDPIMDRLIHINYGKVTKFVKEVIDVDLDYSRPNDQIIILVNNSTFGGGGYTALDVAVSYTGDLGFDVMIHEFGHSFGGLGDEYVVYEEDYPQELAIPYQNIDWDGSKWDDLPGTGVYLGAWYQNLVRPTNSSCIMRTLDYPGFCPVCSRELTSLLEYYSQQSLVEIDVSSVSQSRCDVGSTQSILLHAIWHPERTDVEDGTIYVNGTAFTTNSTGWISFTDTYSTVTKKTWEVTAVDYHGENNFFVTAPNPIIIWDKVQINLHISDDRINVGDEAPITWSGIYEYDETQFKGTVTANDTLRKDEVGLYKYTVYSIHDPTCGLTLFEADSVYCIFDKVTINLSVENEQVEFGSTADITWTSVYEYDLTEYDGEISLNNTLTQDTTGLHSYGVDRISKDRYGINVFECNTVNVIFTPKETILDIFSEGIDYQVPVITNSSIIDHSYDSKTMNFTLTISGVTGTKGETTVMLPKSMVPNGCNITLQLNNEIYPFTMTENVTHYNISTTYTHSDHNITIKFLDITIPIAEAGSDKEVRINEEVSFEATGSTDNIQISHYEWHFGDGENETGETVTHTYTQSGTYSVNLTVQDAIGNTATDTITITVKAATMFQWNYLIFAILIINTLLIIFYLTKVRRTNTN